MFQGPYKNRLIEDDRDFFIVLRYILRNPVAAGITKDVFEYYWATTSYNNDKYSLIDFQYIFNKYENFNKTPFYEFISLGDDDDLLTEIETSKMKDKEAFHVYNKLLLSNYSSDTILNLNEKDINAFICLCFYHKLTGKQIALFSGLTTYRIKKTEKPKFIYI